MNNMYDILDKIKLLEGKASKPDFLDLDKDGDRIEPMKKAAKEKKVDEAVKEVAESDMDESALQAYLGRKKYGEAGMKALQQAGREGASKEKMAAIRARHDKMDEAGMGEGNDFTGARLAAIKAGKPTFSVGGKTYKVTGDTSDEKVMEKKQKTLWPGTPEYKAKFGHEMKTGEKKRSSTGGEIEKTDTGVKHTKSYDDNEEETKADDGAPKKRGRPKGSKRALGAKGPTGKSKLLKDKSIKEGDLEEDYDQDEYDEEGEMAKSQSRTIADAAEELQHMLGDNENLPEWVQKKITLAQEYIDSARDYLKANRPDQDGEEEMIPERELTKPEMAKREKYVKSMKKSKGDFEKRYGDRGEEVMYATATKMAKKTAEAKNEDLVNEYDDPLEKRIGLNRVNKKPRVGQTDFRNIPAGNYPGTRYPYSDEVRANQPGHLKKSLRAAQGKHGPKEHLPEKVKKEVEETTTSGSVATAPAEAPKGKKGMIFGKGVYEGFEAKYNQVLTEGMSINMSVGEDGTKSLNVNATDEDAVKLAQILRLAGMQQPRGYDDACSTCGAGQGMCEHEMVEEADLANSADDTVYADTNYMTQTLAGGLNGPKLQVNPNNPADNPLSMRKLGQHSSSSLNLGSEADNLKEETERRLMDLYQRFEVK